MAGDGSSGIDMESVYRSLRKTSEEIRCFTSKDIASVQMPFSHGSGSKTASTDRDRPNQVNGSNDSGIVDYTDQLGVC